MNYRWLKIIALAAVGAFFIWIGSHLRFKETKVPLPLQGEAISNPYYAAIKLAEQLHAKAAWERIFSMPSSDSVVLLSNWNWSLSRTRRERIQNWVASGGRLVVDNSLIGGADEFEKWAGVKRVDREDEDDGTSDTSTGGDTADGEEAVEEDDSAQADDEATDPEKKKHKRKPAKRDRLIEGFSEENCTELTEDISRRPLRVCGLDTSTALTSSRKLLWALRRDGDIEALRIAVGRGTVTVLNAAPFRYRDFLQGDHPSLFVVATQLHHGDNLFFFTEEDHASLLSLTWRYGAPVVLLLAAFILLALWRNISRFGPLAAVPEKARRSLAEQIRGTGQFTLRFGGGRALHAAAVRALREAAIRRLPAYDRMSAEERVAAVSKLTGVLASELGPALNYSGTRSPHELRNVIAVLEAARRRLIMKKAKA
jgi:hypothetical protein